MKKVTMPAEVRTLIVDTDDQRRVLIEELLRNMGYSTVESGKQIGGLQIRAHANKNRNLLLVLCDDELGDATSDELQRFLAQYPMPVLLLAERLDQQLMLKAMTAGVTGFLSLGVQTNRVEQAMDSAIANHSLLADMQRQIVELKTRLEDRIAIDKAKGLIMKNKGLDEAQAYGFLRDYAMKQGKKLADVSGMVIATAALLEK